MQVWIEQAGRRLRGARAGTPPTTTPTKFKNKYRDARGRPHKYNKTYQNGRTSTTVEHKYNVDYCTVRQAQSVFRVPRCPPDKRTCPRIAVASETCSPRLVSNTSCARSICFPDVDVSRTRQVRCCGTHLNSAKLLFRRYLSKSPMSDR